MKALSFGVPHLPPFFDGRYITCDDDEKSVEKKIANGGLITYQPKLMTQEEAKELFGK